MRRLLLLLVVVSCGVGAATALASFSKGIGPGGAENQAASGCPDGQALVGFYGGAGKLGEGKRVVGRIGAICQRTTVRRRIGSMGLRGDGRTATVRRRCPDGAVAIGIRGRAGELVDRVRLVCQAMNLDGDLSGSTRSTRSIGGRGGTPADADCPGKQHATGFDGAFESKRKAVNFLRLRCSP